MNNISTSGFTLVTSAGQKVTVKETSSTTYKKGTTAAAASAVTTEQTALVLGTVWLLSNASLGGFLLAKTLLSPVLTVLSVALPTLATALHASESDLQWFSAGYLLVLAAMMLPAGLLGDRYGRKKVMLVALALFGAGSAACMMPIIWAAYPPRALRRHGGGALALSAAAEPVPHARFGEQVARP